MKEAVRFDILCKLISIIIVTVVFRGEIAFAGGLPSFFLCEV